MLIQNDRRSKYASLREAAYSEIQQQLPDKRIKLGPITLRQAVATMSWPTLVYFGGREAWSWSDIWMHYTQQYADRFELAISYSGYVCGLSIGRPSRMHKQLGVDLIQGAPQSDHPLKGKIVGITVETAEAYGRQIGATQLRIYSPVKKLIEYYQSHDFRFIDRRVGGRGANYMVRGIS